MTGGSLVDDDVAGSSGEGVGSGEGVESFGTAGSGTDVDPVIGTVDVAALADSGTELETGADEGVRSPSSDDEQPTSRRPAATVDTATLASRRRAAVRVGTPRPGLAGTSDATAEQCNRRRAGAGLSAQRASQ